MRIHLIQNVRIPLPRLLSVGVIASAAVCIAAPLPANAELSAIDRDAYCKEELAYCGTITFENGGGYVVTDVRLKGAAAETEPRILSADSATCESIDVSHKGDISLGNAVAFILPATCTYTAHFKLALAPDLAGDLTLTPGCKITMKSYGTAFEPKLDVKKPGGKTSDAKGNICGDD